MKLVNINKKVFEDFCKENQYDNFFQSKYYAEIKRIDGFHTYFLGLEESGKILGAAMVISKEISIFKKREFYIPRGFIIDYKNNELLKIFTKKLVEFVKEKKGAYIKINPMVILYDRTGNGDVIEGGINNKKLVDNLKNLGWHQDDNELIYPLEDRFLYNLNLKNKNDDELYDNLSDSLKETLKIQEEMGITTRKLEKDNIQKFIDILENCSEEIDYLNLNYGNYYDIINVLDNHNMLDITVAELDIDKYLNYLVNQKEKDDSNEELDEQIEIANQLKYEYGHNTLISVLLGVIYNKEYYVLTNSTVDILRNLKPQLAIYWDTIKYAKKLGCEIYNFYEIGNDLEDNELLNDLKDYNGKVVELIGEFNYILIDKYYKNNIKEQKKAFN